MQHNPELLYKWIGRSVGKTEVLLGDPTSCCVKDQGPDQRSKHQLARDSIAVILGRSERE